MASDQRGLISGDFPQLTVTHIGIRHSIEAQAGEVGPPQSQERGGLIPCSQDWLDYLGLTFMLTYALWKIPLRRLCLSDMRCGQKAVPLFLKQCPSRPQVVCSIAAQIHLSKCCNTRYNPWTRVALFHLNIETLLPSRNPMTRESLIDSATRISQLSP